MGKLSASMAFALLFAGAHATSPRVTILYEDNHSTTMSTTARIDDNGLPPPHNGKVATVLIGVRYKYGVYLPPDTIFMDCRTRRAFWNARGRDLWPDQLGPACFFRPPSANFSTKI